MTALRSDLDQRVVVPDAVLFRKVAGTSVLLDVRSGLHCSLNEVGTRVMEMLLARRSLRAIVETLVEEYEVAREVLAADVLRIVHDLQARGLLQGGAPSGAAPESRGERALATVTTPAHERTAGRVDTEHPKVQPEQLWYADTTRGLRIVVSGYLEKRGGQRLQLASARDIDVLERCDGSRTIRTIASELDARPEDVAATIEAWEKRAPGTFRSVRAPETEQRESHRTEAERMAREWKAAREALLFADNAPYHVHGISDASHQFESVESTVSHAFRDRHPALGGRSFAEAFCDELLGIGALKNGCRVLEIGCGTGLFARNLLRRLQQRQPTTYDSIRYTLFDLSPALQASQREICAEQEPRVRFVRGNAEDHTFGEESFDLIIANEMLADLSVGVADRTRLAAGVPANDAERKVSGYGLDYARALRSFVVNVGAIKLVESLSRWLSPHGVAVLTEYGAEGTFPIAIELGGHREHEIHFGHLTRVAAALSLQPTLQTLGDFLGFDPRHEIIDHSSFRLLSRHLLPFLGRESLPVVAYDADMLRRAVGEDIDQIGNLNFHPLEDQRAMLTPFRFQALVLRAQKR